MGKYKYKWVPFENGDLEYIESWLTDLAQKGLVLAGFTGRWAKLKKTEPLRCRYRLDACGGNKLEPDDELMDMYSDFGWSFVATYGERYYIFRTTDPHAPELHTDPDIQRQALKKAAGSVWGQLLFSTALYLATIGIIMYSLLSNDSPLLNLVDGGSVKYIYILLMMTALLITDIFNAKRLIAFKRRLKTGKLNHRISCKKTAALSLTSAVIVILLSLGWYGILFSGTFNRHAEDISEYGETLPFPVLSDIDGGSGDNIGWIDSRTDILAPVYIELMEFFNGSSYHVWYYEFITDGLAQRAADELELKISAETSASRSIDPVSVDGEAAYYVSDDQQFLVIHRGCTVISVWYGGEKPLTEYYLRQINS